MFKKNLQESHQKQEEGSKPKGKGKVTDHLANERTWLAWLRTGLAIIGLGFIISRFGLLLRAQMDSPLSQNYPHYSSIIGAVTTALGVAIILVALWKFLQVRQAIENEQFYPSATIEYVLTGLIVSVGIILVIYLSLVH